MQVTSLKNYPNYHSWILRQDYGKDYLAGVPKYDGFCTVPDHVNYCQVIDNFLNHIRHEGRRNETCFVFEGFMDYLSFLTIRTKKCPQMPCLDWQDYIILNSVSNLHKAIDGLAVYERIHCFFDNDRAGTEAFQRLANEYSYRVRDASHTYKDCKDLNEYLVRQRSVQEQKTEQIVPPKRSKGRSL